MKILLLLLSLTVRHQALALSSGWRIALNIGREPWTQMPSSWASSGCRLPIVVKCDFTPDKKVIPQDSVVKFTGPDGQVVHPIGTGTWELTDAKNLQFSLEFPTTLTRRDVVLEPCTMTCSGLLYSKSELDDLNEAFYRARDETWKAGEAVNDIARQKEAPKKWNPETNQWEVRYQEPSLASKLAKRLELARTQQREREESAKRPNPKILSLDSGPFPGVEGHVYIQKEGTISIRQGWRDVVIGTWGAEPINGKPISYYPS